VISEVFERKMKKAEYQARYQRARYAWIRAWAIWYLGGECYCCHDTENLEIHDVEPVLEGRGQRRGWTTLKRWMTLIPQGRMLLVCRDCHVNVAHHGNTNELKKVKNGY